MLQKLINFVYRYPKARLKTYQRFGGYLSYRKMIRLNESMKLKAKTLPPVVSHPDALKIFFLTGKKYIHQTLFCITSLVNTTTLPFNFGLVDDGSFDDKIIGQIKNQLPGATIITREIIEQNIAATLPKDRYPVLHQKRAVYAHIKKLTDIHTIAGNEWKLVLDSDMLFWNEPTALIEWLKSPTQPLHMVDCQESYGYSKALMEKLTGKKIPSLLNVGVIGLNSAAINWDVIERWVKELEETEGKTYYLEQALCAMIVAENAAVVLPEDTYIVNPGKKDILDKKGILHHYVDLSKEGYFKFAWQKLI